MRRQSEHPVVYRAAIERLAQHGLVYRSFESRAGIARLVRRREATALWPRDPDGVPLFPGARLAAADEARLLAAGTPYAWRLDIATACRRPAH